MKVDKSKWEKKTLGEIGQIITGSTPSTKDSLNYESDDISFFKPGDLNDHSINELSQSIDSISYYGFENSRKLPAGTILVTCIGIIGKIGILSKPATCNQQINAIICNNNFSNKFIAYNILFHKAILSQKANGPVVPIINKSTFSTYIIKVPKFISEQQAIASELDAIQKIIDAYKAQLADLDALAQSIFFDMFGDPVTNPKKWGKDELKKHASIGTGSTPSRKITSYYEGNIPWVKSTEVHNSYIYETQEYITQEAVDNSNCTIYSPNTILVAMYGQGKTRGQVGLLKIKAATNQACAAIYCKDSLDYLFCYWHLQICYDANRKLGNGTNQKNMNLSIVGNIKFIIPPLPLQQQFAEQVEAIERQKELIRQQLADAETLMAERMQYYFS